MSRHGVFGPGVWRWASVLLVAGLVAACAPAPAPPAAPASPPAATAAPTPTPAPRYGGTLVIAGAADPPNLDGQQTCTLEIAMVAGPAYNSLIQYDPQGSGKIIGDLATEWSASADARVYTFKLRQGVKWHDGKPFTVEDAVFNLERIGRPPKGASSCIGIFLPLEKAEAVDSTTVRMTLKSPLVAALSALAIDYAPLYPKHVVVEKGDMKTTILGTGPFRLKSYTPGVGSEVVRNPDYFVGGRPYLDGISVRTIKDQATRLAAVRTGQVHMTGRLVAALTPSEGETAKKANPAIQLYPHPSVYGRWFFMNQRVAPFSDIRVRRAVQLAVDRQAALKVVAEGQGLVGNIFPLEGWGIPRDELLKMPGWRQPKGPDIEEAKKLLAAAGYATGFPLTIHSRPAASAGQDAAVLLSGLLRQSLGLEIKVEAQENAVFWDTLGRGGHTSAVYNPSMILPDPHPFGRFFVPKGSLNYAGNDADQKLADLWNKQAATLDVAARKALIEQVERYLLFDEVVVVPLAWPQQLMAVAPQVRNFVLAVTDFTNNRLQEVWLAE